MPEVLHCKLLEDGKIQRANLDGTGVEDLVASGLVTPQGLALDVPGGKMYWVDSGAGFIQRANLSGRDTKHAQRRNSEATAIRTVSRFFSRFFVRDNAKPCLGTMQ